MADDWEVAGGDCVAAGATGPAGGSASRPVPGACRVVVDGSTCPFTA
ncbi:MAG: hypothetical protein ACYCTF_00875 [Acidiferrobacter sp.]